MRKSAARTRPGKRGAVTDLRILSIFLVIPAAGPARIRQKCGPAGSGRSALAIMGSNPSPPQRFRPDYKTISMTSRSTSPRPRPPGPPG